MHVAVVALVALLASSCGGEDEVPTDPRPSISTCQAACQRVYSTCNGSFTDAAGDSITADECVRQCDAGALRGAEDCIAKMECTQTALDACRYLNGGPCATDPAGPDCAACVEPERLTCYGGDRPPDRPRLRARDDRFPAVRGDR